MSRTAEDWHAYRKLALEARALMQDAAGLLSLMQEDLRFDDQHAEAAYAEDKLFRAITNLNTVIGSVTGGWWDEENTTDG